MKVGALSRVQGFVSPSLLVASLLVASLLGAAGAASGAPASGASIGGASLDDEKQARTLYERAEKSFDLGKFAEALTDYQAAYEAKPLPGFLFNIAQCYRNMGNFERARFFFRRYLALDPRAPNRRRVDELIDEMTKQLDAQAAAPVAPAPPPVEPKPVEAPPVVAAPAAPPSIAEPPLPPSESQSAPLVTATAPAPAETRAPLWKRWWFWTGVGVVAAGVAAGYFLTRPETVTPGSLQPIDGRGL